MLAKNSLPLFPFERSVKDGSNSNSTTFTPFSKAKNLFITGHSSGAINFWDASYPLLLPIASITQQVISRVALPISSFIFGMLVNINDVNLSNFYFLTLLIASLVLNDLIFTCSKRVLKLRNMQK